MCEGKLGTHERRDAANVKNKRLKIKLSGKRRRGYRMNEEIYRCGEDGHACWGGGREGKMQSKDEN